MRIPPTSRGAPFPPHTSRSGILSLHVRERIPGVPVASHEEALSTGKAEELQGRATIPRVPQISQSAGVQPRWIQGIRRMDGVVVESLFYLLT